MHRVYATLAFLCASSMGCTDLSCPEGQTKIGNVCHRFGDASPESTEDDDSTAADAGRADTEGGAAKLDATTNRDAAAEPDPAAHDASLAGSDGSSSTTGVTTSQCATDNGGCDPLTTCNVVVGKVSCGPSIGTTKPRSVK